MTKNTELYDTAQGASYLGISKGTLPAWRMRGVGPRFLKVGALVYYTKRELDAYLASCTRNSTSDPGPVAARGSRR